MEQTKKVVVPTDYNELKKLATEMGIDKPHTIKKDTLIQMVTEKANQSEEKLPPGRPVNPNSKRQQRIADLEARRAAGTLKLGRPVETESERQKRIAERQTKVDAYNAQQKAIADGAVIAEEDLLPNPNEKLGRPIDPNSPRQIKLREYEAKKAAGLIKKGRPKMNKEEATPTTVTVNENETEAMPVDVAEVPAD